MTIRLQIFIFVALLFAALGAVSSAVAWRLETSVAHRAFESNAQAAAVTMAEFVDPADVAAMKIGTPLTQTRLGTVWVRLQRWSIVRRFYRARARHRPPPGRYGARLAPARPGRDQGPRPRGSAPARAAHHPRRA